MRKFEDPNAIIKEGKGVFKRKPSKELIEKYEEYKDKAKSLGYDHIVISRANAPMTWELWDMIKYLKIGLYYMNCFYIGKKLYIIWMFNKIDWIAVKAWLK